MTSDEFYEIARGLQNEKPNDETGTVSQKRMWPDILAAVSNHVVGFVDRAVSVQRFREIANGTREWRHRNG